MLSLTFFAQFMLLSAKNTLVLFTLDCEAYAGIVGLILIELVVLAGQDSVQDNAGQRADCQSGQADGNLTDVECDSTCCTIVDTDGQYQNQSGDDNVTTLCGSLPESLRYYEHRLRRSYHTVPGDTPPQVAVGIQPINAATFGEKENSTAKPAAIRITLGSNTLVRDSTPVFSP